VIRTAAVIAVKPPELAKRRLAARLDASSRSALARAMCEDVLAAVAQARHLDATILVTTSHSLMRHASAHGAHAVADAGGGYSAAAATGIRHALAAGFERVLVLPADVPLLDPRELDALLARVDAAGAEVAVVPDRHQLGTNALLLHPPEILVPAFGAGSFARHRQLAERAGVAVRVERLASLALDVDTPADLECLRTAAGGPGPATQLFLRALGPDAR
jgi:2-phospho-L-lactate guanylyltransferase